MDLLTILVSLADDENVRVAYKKSTTGAIGSVAIGGAGSIIGLLVAGPLGVIVGGAAAGILSYTISRSPGNFRNLSEVILNDLSEKQKQRLFEQVVKAVSKMKKIRGKNVIEQIYMNKEAKIVALNTTKTYVTKTLGMTILK
ncbi:protein C19orf12 homolog [Drosophila eugracilis]|uniref:protein C19orf12 homolog n=1 Tax=Drosophila eugracilis TaxID=29029 RepID=UPI0007E62F4B|nr:protein C19orf12 homolog [Drosophila eugracilis]